MFNTDVRIDVRDFGVLGDGVTDDAPAIRNVLNIVDPRVPVYFPTGTYGVRSGIDITNRRIFGDPPVGGRTTGTIIKVLDTTVSGVVASRWASSELKARSRLCSLDLRV
jgi:hypothetical protein